MKRRKFLSTTALAGLTFGLPINNLAGKLSSQKNFSNMMKLNKVKNAMLGMMRRTWEQGVAMQALLESGDEELVIIMAKDAILYQSADGRLCMNDSENNALSDACSPGEAVSWAAQKTGDKDLMDAFNKLVDYALTKAPRNKDGVIYHFVGGNQVWSDTNYMLPPFLAVAGKYEEAFKQFNGACDLLLNKDKHLLMHQWDCEKNSSPRKDLWSVGNGWTIAGGTRIIKSLPNSMHQEKLQLIQRVTQFIDAAIQYQREDGLFHDVIDNPNSFIETNFSQMLAYSIFRGVKAGWLDKKYLENAHKMRNAAHSKVDSLGFVQGVCGAPFFDRSSVAVEAQAFFIMMEVAYKQLSN